MLDVYAKSHNQIVSPGQCLIKKTAIPNEWLEYTTKNNGSDDLLLWVIMLSRGKKFVINKNPIYTHKYTGANLSDNIPEMRKSSLEIAEYLENIVDIDPKVIRNIKRSRKLGEDWVKSNFIIRVKLMCKNIDLLAVRFIWKIKSSILN